MNGKTYRKLKDKVAKGAAEELVLKIRKSKETTQKMTLQSHVIKFVTQDDLFELLEAMKIGLGILESEGFPLEELSIYKLKLWMSRIKNSKK